MELGLQAAQVALLAIITYYLVWGDDDDYGPR
jgi:hypothetical protein